MHQRMAEVTEHCVNEIRSIQQKARTAPAGTPVERPRWPMIILRTPKGWTCPKEIDGHKLEGSWRAHQMSILDPVTNPEHLALVESWMQSIVTNKSPDVTHIYLPPDTTVCSTTRQWLQNQITDTIAYSHKYGIDSPEVRSGSGHSHCRNHNSQR